MKSFYKLLILFLLLSANQATLKANIINVPGNYLTIQAGINASNNGDTVLVEPGTYFENVLFNGKKIVLTSRFYIANNLSFINSTIINGSNPHHPDSASCVRIHQGEDSTTVLQGFTITGGKGTKWQDEHFAGRYTEGGGILTAYVSAIIRYCVIRDNEAMMLGTGITSSGGGGIRSGDGNAKFYNCIIMNNTARYGAGVVLNYTGATIKNCVISGNYGSNAYGAGTALWINNNLGALPKIIENNTVVNNSATNAGTGGIYAGANNVFVRNCIFWNNTGPSGGYLGNPVFSYTDINATVTGTGNINAVPQFDSANFILGAGSPCVDAGDTAIIYNDKQGAPGMALYPSRGTIRNDIGAYGGQLAAILLSNTFVNIKKITGSVADRFELQQNYPNPFNPVTKIVFDVPANGKMSNVRLAVFDITGKLVTELVNRVYAQGRYEVTFTADKLSSGTYFYRLTSENFSEVKKMTLLK
jgi:hypothetical protein